jgi:hypothetical protein
MATTNVTITVHVDSSDFDRSIEKVIEHSIAAAVEITAKRELKKTLAGLREEREAREGAE